MSRWVKISLGLHGLVLFWLLFGRFFTALPKEPEVTEVVIVSEAEFEALFRQEESAPEPEAEPELEPIVVPEPIPEPSLEPEPAPAPIPKPELEPVLEPVPEPEPLSEPVPLSEPEPEPLSDPIPVPEPVLPTVPEIVAPLDALRPVPRPAPRVASEAQEAPVQDVTEADEVQQTTSPDTATDQVAEENLEATAPPETTTEIVTEAEEPAAAPTASLRPQTRPNRPAPTPSGVAESTDEALQANAEPDAQAPSDTSAAINDALSEVLGNLNEKDPTGNNAPDLGPPLTQSDLQGFQMSVQSCWNVNVGSESAGITVELAFGMEPDGRVVESSITLFAVSDGSAAAQQVAYDAARRALLRCEGEGYPLPEEKYEQWKSTVMKFDPETMQFR